MLTDHKALESWATEYLDTLSGPTGRRARWHELLSKFDISVAYVPAKDNVVADALSRWASPASTALNDSSIHGSDLDSKEMKAEIRRERKEERESELFKLLSTEDSSPTIISTLTRRGLGTTPGDPAPPPSVDESIPRGGSGEPVLPVDVPGGV